MKLHLNLLFNTIVLMFIIPFSFSFASTGVKKQKNIPYVNPSAASFDKKRHTLDVFYPEQKEELHDVFIFVHGGSWNSGKKNSYKFLGRNFAKKGVVEVNINYRLSPQVDYKAMAADVAAAIVWVKDHIKEYGGNPDRIFISGHSAGGHLAALVAMNNEYFEDQGIKNPLKGVVIIDGFCLDLIDYFKISAPQFSKNYYPVFSSEELNWQIATPANYAERTNLPFIIFSGSKTYPAISIGNGRFKSRMDREGKKCEYIIIKGKRHVGMILQMYRSKNQMYKYILDFMNQAK